MHWPVGPPTVYVAGSPQSTPKSTTTHHSSSSSHPKATNGEHFIENSQTTPNGVSGPGQHEDIAATSEAIVSINSGRKGSVFATITESTLTIWWARPICILTASARTLQSLEEYGRNARLFLHPNSIDFIIQTSRNYILIYSLAIDPSASVYNKDFGPNARSHTRKHSAGRITPFQSTPTVPSGVIRFRTAIPVNEGIRACLVYDNGAVVSTSRAAEVRYIPWPEQLGVSADALFNETAAFFEYQEQNQCISQLDSFGWMAEDTDRSVIQMEHDRRMNISVWVTASGRAYIVQTIGSLPETQSEPVRFVGHLFHDPKGDIPQAKFIATNARFSLIAVGCADNTVHIYSVKDYKGRVDLSHVLNSSQSGFTSGALSCLHFSPDGYCLYTGFEKGWVFWSVFGQFCSSSSGARADLASKNDDPWLLTGSIATWLAGGSQLAIVSENPASFSVLTIARSSAIGCFSPSNISHSLLQTDTSVLIYRDPQNASAPSLATGSGSSWETVSAPLAYLNRQWPLRCAVISPDGRYIAVAGQSGLAHYSVQSTRWRTLEMSGIENEFTVRGGMCWFRNYLIVAVETAGSFELRAYSREKSASAQDVVHISTLESPIIHISPSAQESLLVYTHDNSLHHFVINQQNGSIRLDRVGQLSLTGIVRSPLRVRGISWIVPDGQLQHGELSKDVASASVMFLVDDKLVVLQPSDDHAETKYDMRIIAKNVEYYIMMRDAVESTTEMSVSRSGILPAPDQEPFMIQDSLWYFDGSAINVWLDTQEVLVAAQDHTREIVRPIKVEMMAYPISVHLRRGSILCVKSSIVQHRAVEFALPSLSSKTVLFLSQVLDRYLSGGEMALAIEFANCYQDVAHFPFSLELLLHTVMHREFNQGIKVDQGNTSLLPAVLLFLSSFTYYLDTIAHCLRKSELGSWPTLLQHLPPPRELFEESLAQSKLKTAGSFLLVVTTMNPLTGEKIERNDHRDGGVKDRDESGSGDGAVEQEPALGQAEAIRLFRAAKFECDWELCKELSRFLMALDNSGTVLTQMLKEVELDGGLVPSGNRVLLSPLDGIRSPSSSKRPSGPCR